MSRQLYEIKYNGYNAFNTALQEYENITFIGIQGKPNLGFKINDSGTITIGNTGILQIDLTNGDIPPISSIQFSQGTPGNLPLIVHLIAEKKAGGN